MHNSSGLRRLLAVPAALILTAGLAPGLAASAVPAGRPAAFQTFGSCHFEGNPGTDPSQWPRGGSTDAVNVARYRCSIAVNDRDQVAFSTDVDEAGDTYRHAMFSSRGDVTDIGALLSTQIGEPVDSLVRDINNSGLVVGIYQARTTGSPQLAFSWLPGSATVTIIDPTVNFPGTGDVQGGSLDPRGVNDAGDIVLIGAFPLWPENGYRAFVLQADGSTYVLPHEGTTSPGGPAIIPSGINEAGVVVGGFSKSLTETTTATRAFRWTVGDVSLTELPLAAGLVDATANGVSNLGQVVGMSGIWAQDPQTNIPPIATSWAASPPHTPTLLPWAIDPDTGENIGYTEATAVNDHGVIVGLMNQGQDLWTATRWSKKQLSELAAGTGYMSAATGINKGGRIVGVRFTEYMPGDDGMLDVTTVMWK